MRLTDLSIKALKLPAKGHTTYRDDTLPGFGVRVSQGGTKSFFLMHGSQRERLQIGRVGVISLAEARASAKKFLAERTLGKRENATLRFGEAMAVFFETQSDRLRPSTRQNYERVLRAHFERPLKFKPLTEIQTYHLTGIIDRLLPTKAECNYAFAVARRFFRWAVSRRYIPHSPLEGVGMPAKLVARTRVLSDLELAEIWHAAGDGHFGSIIRLCILTGQRRGEIAAMRSEWIDGDRRTITFPSGITKNGREHTIPFPPLADGFVAGDGLLFPARGRSTPFNGWSKAKLALDKRLQKVAPFAIHDLRRSVATQWASLGVAPHVIERMLNHVTGTISGVAAIYNRFQYAEEMRLAMQAWDGRLRHILASSAP